MPSPERPGGYHPERRPALYYQAARFPNERSSGVAYFQAQEAIFKTPDCDLSVYRLQLNRIWHVAAIGEPPPPELERRLESIFSDAEPMSLPSDVLRALQARRAEAIKQGPWVERHYPPGK